MDKMDKSEPRYTGGMRVSLLPADEAKLVRFLVEYSFSSVGEEELADHLGYSLTQFRRLSRLAVGEPVVSFARRLRLERAAGRLMQDNADLPVVSAEAGFLSWEAFSKAFHRHFESAPTAFIELNRSFANQMPGYLLSLGQNDDLPRTVRFYVSKERMVAFLYDGPILLARVLPGGAVDWLPRRRKQLPYF